MSSKTCMDTIIENDKYMQLLIISAFSLWAINDLDTQT